MVIKTATYAKFQQRYGGRYIARIGNTVMASGTTYRALLKDIQKRRLDRSTLTVGFVPPKGAICIYSAHAR